MSSKRDWTEGLPELFEGYTESEPAGLWSAVRAGVVAGRRRVAAWWYAGGALLAAAAVVALVVLFRPAADPSVVNVSTGDLVAEDVTSEAAEEAPVAAADGIGSETAATLGTNSPKIDRFSGAPVNNLNAGVERSETVSDPIPSAAPNPSVPAVSDGASAAETIADTETPESVSGNGQTTVPLEREPWKPRQPRERQRARIKIQAGVYGGALMAQNISQSGQQAAHVASMMGSAPAIQTKSMSGGATTFNPSIINRNKPSTTESNHRQSARFGAGIKVNFLPRWGVETGIVGTTLNSSWETTTGNSVQTIEQEMHYLGIPLFVHFNALEREGLSLYLAAGPMYEFTNETSETWSTRLNGKLVSSAADQSLQKDSRWSANIAAGLQLEFMENNAIYIQPGFSYHFPHRNVDGLDLQNYYTAKPAAFNLTIGYRLLLF